MKSFNKPFFWLAAGIVGFFLACTLYVSYLQSSLLSRREFVVTILFWLILTPLLYLLLSRFLAPRLNEFSPRGKRNWLLLSIIVGLLTALVTQPPALILLFPVHTLQISIPAGEKDRTITLEYAKTSLRDIGFGEFILQGDWQRTDKSMSHSGSQPASLTWTGRTGGSASLVFSDTPMVEAVQVGWDGHLIPLDFSAAFNGQKQITYDLKTGPMGVAVAYLIVGLTIGFLFLVITLFLVGLEMKVTQPVKRRKGFWLLYALPMIAVWSIYFLTFFPGIMTPDSIRQWGQVISGQFNDALPVTHTLLVIMLTRLWFSPAAVIVFQIVMLGLAVAWGIRLIEDYGLSRWGGWFLAWLFALSPVNGNLVITLWKDIPYSTCLLLLSLMLLKVVLSRGNWLNWRYTWLLFGLVSLGIGLFRLNGPPVPVITLILLMIVYRKQWKPVLSALMFYLGLWILIQGPIFDYLKVDRNTGFKQQIFIHHIAAHIATGSPLTSEEARLASGILPLDEWAYDCCTNIPIWQVPGYSEELFSEKARTIQQLFVNLALKEPGVELRHTACVSSLVWQVPNRCAVIQDPNLDNSGGWIENNAFGLKENSLIPQMVAPLERLNWLVNQRPFDILFYTPAIFLFLGIYCTSIFAYRAKNFLYLLFMLPSVIHSMVMMLVNVSRDFRYQYGVYLVGLFSLGLLILSFTLPENKLLARDNNTPDHSSIDP